MSGPQARQDINQVLVEVSRGDLVESGHRGAFVVVREDGSVIRSSGDIDRPFFPRSSLKFIHALPLIETGAADRFGLDAVEIALAAASHSGDAMHIERIASWLFRLGIGEQALLCGPHAPFSERAAAQLARQGRAPGSLHNNNSGKHAAFLTTARHLGESLDGYLEPMHPVQLRLKSAVERVTGAKLNPTPQGLERCGMPMYAISLRELAVGMARFGFGTDLEPDLAVAAQRITSAVSAHPDYVTGARRLPSLVCTATQGRVVVKGGSEGSYAGFLRHERIALSLKIDDGASRAADVLLLDLLGSLGVEEVRSDPGLQARARQAVNTAAGQLAGYVSACNP